MASLFAESVPPDRDFDGIHNRCMDGWMMMEPRRWRLEGWMNGEVLTTAFELFQDINSKSSKLTTRLQLEHGNSKQHDDLA